MSNRLNKNTTSFNHKNVLVDSTPNNTTEDSQRPPGTIFKLNNPFIKKNLETTANSAKINRVYKSRNKSNECRSNSKNLRSKFLIVVVVVVLVVVVIDAIHHPLTSFNPY